ncbi:hypothetical protein [Ferrimicrobium sp.]|uniref:hypothetical protein n=1 Tax=Ferrimicrobium sp. TaxID=2926050 RepID=UPI00260F018A|nr:hypothetical protein [Ferrimicrobium sp.]
MTDVGVVVVEDLLLEVPLDGHVVCVVDVVACVVEAGDEIARFADDSEAVVVAVGANAIESPKPPPISPAEAAATAATLRPVFVRCIVLVLLVLCCLVRRLPDWRQSRRSSSAATVIWPIDSCAPQVSSLPQH